MEKQRMRRFIDFQHLSRETKHWIHVQTFLLRNSEQENLLTQSCVAFTFILFYSKFHPAIKTDKITETFHAFLLALNYLTPPLLYAHILDVSRGHSYRNEG